MLEFNRIFCELKLHFAQHVEWTNVQDWLSCDDDNPEVIRCDANKFWMLPMCGQNVRNQDNQLQVLRELASCIRSLRNDAENNTNIYDISLDNWAKIDVITPKDYLAYIYAVTSLATLPQQIIEAAPEAINENMNVKLAINAFSTYLLTLTIPGAKSFGVFDADVIEHGLRVFRLLEMNANSSIRSNNIWMLFLTIFDDLKLVLCYVHFKDHLTPRDNIIRSLLKILYMNFKQGYTNSYAQQIHNKCFELFHEIANEQNGDVHETLTLFMNQTLCMHICPENTKGMGPKSGEHISDWFIKLLEKYPDIMASVLERYIECIITNPIKEWKTVDEKIAIGYAAKYDAALFAKCNKSCTDFLVESVKADDAVGIQLRSLELIDCILQNETQVNWRIFQHDVSTKQREVDLIRETILCLDDRTFTVRRKASQVLISAIKQGSPITSRILNEIISFVQFTDQDMATETAPNGRQLELNAEKQGILKYAFSFEGHEELEPLVLKMPQVIYDRFLSSSNGLARCSGIALLERLVLINQRIIYDTDFERETSLLAVDILSSVRKSALESIDTLMHKYFNCTILIDVYCRIWPCMLNDEDTALQRITLHSFNRNVLLAIKPLEFTNQPKDLLPWRILTTLLGSQPRDYLQQRLSLLLQTENLVNSRLVNTIISHLCTPMATEAWTLLLLISSRITNNLDAIISTFNGLSSFNMKSNQVLALQLISYCLSNFSKASLNQLFNHLISALSTGSIWLALISPALLLLGQIDKLSQSQAPRNSSNADSWKRQLLQQVTEALYSCIDHFQEDHIRLTSLLTTYTELIVMLPIHVDPRIVEYCVDYIQKCNEMDESNFDTDNERIVNWMIVAAGRLSLRDHKLANRVAKLYGQILRTNDRPQLINNTLIGLNDLGKKYPTILENNMKCILSKLFSKYPTTRVRAYRCVKDVILAGIIKLRGPILIALLSGLLDDSAEVAHEADEFFIRYKKLYDKSLFHHCLKENPFHFNGQAFLKGSARFKSPLQGPEKRKNRRLLYNHIIAALDDHTLLMYFGQLKLLAEKTKDKEFITSNGALDVVMDILFIMRRICFYTKNKRQQSGDQADDENEEESIVEELAPAVPAVQQPATTSTATGRGRGRGARRRETAEEPLKQLERCLRYVEETHRNLRTVMSSEMRQEFNQFCRAMTMRFPNYTDFAQPAEFWQKYKQSKTKGKRRRPNGENDTGIESMESNTDTDNELPLERHKTTATTSSSGQRRSNYDVLATELIFQPHDF
ncbi:uncharacterized protein LOC6562734 [Drosophila grimshawi]|uniref:GH10294 n=1 Tax=Drosophila grimshawi TaxID=7222 RepID=B4JAF6_DROGR|nr:uncharacterized protein LOC6562734 [Drosophila grimshawi]EDW03827.1 GH10294 [Drosophila grimshawi]